MHIIFPKGQTIEGKEERGEEPRSTATQHRTHSCTPTHSLTVSRTRTQPRPRLRGRRSGHEERAKSHGRSLARGRRHISNRRERERTVRPLFSASPSQGFFDVADADVKEGRKEPLAAPRERAMHEEVIPDAGDAGHFTIGTDREEQNVGKNSEKVSDEGYHFPLELAMPSPPTVPTQRPDDKIRQEVERINRQRKPRDAREGYLLEE